MAVKYEPCRKCGGTEFTYKLKMKGTCEFFVMADGSPADNQNMHDALTYTQVGVARCVTCKTKAVTLQPST